ncbi:MAG: nucleotide sugar dehydrogenase [Cyanobacteria bacterium NC_groundwater_1444_Ag_S-0.65um_54_12]|nr:nucleotide sugar dehydrogenase [Cyanobacteria bacterium NC_groundwater_1444_Ag_S-0.65um_54_12]
MKATSPASAATLARSGSTTSVAIVGGCGHIGLPLGLSLTARGHSVMLIDTSAERIAQVQHGLMPFYETGAQTALERSLESKLLSLSTKLETLADMDVVVVTIGTPIDEFLNPDIGSFERSLAQVLSYMKDGQLLILRSTVFPGVTERLGRVAQHNNLSIDIAYCPERTVQGVALQELEALPQLIGGLTALATQRASTFFDSLGARVIELSSVEAELAKLFTNSYRYIGFAISNQLYMIARRFQANFDQIYRAVRQDYPRMAGFALPGFAGGPCLLKDTMQLAAFNHNMFALGQAAMMVNEGLPSFLVDELKAKYDLRNLTAGILGMAFKGDSDDQRSSLAYKLRKILAFECQHVLCTDPYIADPTFVSLDQLLAEADIIIVGAPHSEYRQLKVAKLVVDPFCFVERLLAEREAA